LNLTHFCKGYSARGPPVGSESLSPLGHVAPASQRYFEINIASSLLADFSLRSAPPDHTNYSKKRQKELHFTREFSPFTSSWCVLLWVEEFFTPLGLLSQERDSRRASPADTLQRNLFPKSGVCGALITFATLLTLRLCQRFG